MADLPFQQYRCHKIVGALPICWIERHASLRAVGDSAPAQEPCIRRLDFGTTYDLPVGSLDDPDPKLFARYSPRIGDYLVRYEDGFLSISPREAFEAGYRPLSEGLMFDLPIG